MRPRAAVTAIVVATGLGVALVSCRQIVGIGDSPPSTPTAACGLPYGASECAACMQSHCCTESSACAADPACLPRFDCVGRCAVDDWQCYAQCRYDHPIGKDAIAEDYAKLGACQLAHCDVACGLQCSDLGAFIAPPDRARDCQSCVAENMCTAARACASSVDCWAFAQCHDSCSTPDCQGACYAAHDAGGALFSPVGSGFAGTCATSCDVGGDWACVGRLTWPPAQGAVTLTATVHDLRNNPVAGADVQVCSFAQGDSCTASYAKGNTDAMGSVSLTVAPVSSNSGLAFVPLDASSYLQVTPTGPNAVTTLFFWGFPPSEPVASLGNVPVGTTADWQQYAAAQGLDLAPDPMAGTLGFQVYDCTLLFGASGVSVSLGTSDSAQPLYGSPLSSTAKSTDKSGTGVFPNLAPGPVTLTATPLALGKKSGTTRAFVRAGAITQVNLYPTP